MSIVHGCDFGAKVQLLQRLNTFFRFIGVLLKTCVVHFYLWCTVLFDILEDANAVIIDDVRGIQDSEYRTSDSSYYYFSSEHLVSALFCCAQLLSHVSG